MTRWLNSALLLTLLAGCQPGVEAPRPGRSGPWELAGRVHAENDSVVLTLELTNRSNRTRELAVADLPWNSLLRLNLVVVEEGSLKPLRRLFPIRDKFDPSSIALDPAESVSGTLPLSQHFPDLHRAFESGPVLVFWSYEIRGEDADASERVEYVLGGVRAGPLS